MFLFRLVYYSRSQVNHLGLSVSKEIKSILESCTRNNAALGLTGALVFNEHYFAQVLEGDRGAVTSTFCKIANDNRHSDLVIMEAVPVPKRLFANWSMAYAGHSDMIDKLYLKYAITIGLNPSRMTADSLLGLIAELVQADGHVAHADILQQRPDGTQRAPHQEVASAQ